jgi:hypothetical protein
MASYKLVLVLSDATKDSKITGDSFAFLHSLAGLDSANGGHRRVNQHVVDAQKT